MQIVGFTPNSAVGKCKDIKCPTVYQEALDFGPEGADGDGSAAVDLLPLVAATDPAPHGGQVLVDGCDNVKLVLTYLQGDTCDPCSTVTVTTKDVELVAYKGELLNLPEGYITQITAEVVDATGATIAAEGAVTVRYQACNTDCPECVVNGAGETAGA